jgi:hypothetical protein
MKDEDQSRRHVRHPLPTTPTTNSSYPQWRKVPDEILTIFSGADRFGPYRLHADIYEPIVNYLGIAGGIVKRGERHRPTVAMPPDMRIDGHAPALESAKAQLGEN